jgi:hypothetical protein
MHIIMWYTVGYVHIHTFVKNLGQTSHRLTLKKNLPKNLYALHCGNEAVQNFPC